MRIKKLAPWEIYYKQIQAFFKKDPDVKVVYDHEGQVITLYVDDDNKAGALDVLLPSERNFGNVSVDIIVKRPNEKIIDFKGTLELIHHAFKDNEAVEFIENVTGLWSAIYVVFQKEVIQYYSDDMGDINGNTSTLYQDIARDISGSDRYHLGDRQGQRLRCKCQISADGHRRAGQ